MIKSAISLQDLRWGIYIKAKAEPAIDTGTAKYAEVLKIPEGAYNGSAPDLGAKELAKHP